MLTYTMTEEERMKEIEADILNVYLQSNKHDAKFRRIVLTSSLFPVNPLPAKYVSPRKNRWLIFFESRNKKEIGDLARVTFVCYMDTPEGIIAFMPVLPPAKFQLNIYLPHFFSRYAERAGIDKHGIDLISHFFRYNNDYAYTETFEPIFEAYLNEDSKTRSGRIAISGSMKDGVGLGYVTGERNILFKTFITYNMAKGNQVKDFTEKEKIRQESRMKR